MQMPNFFSRTFQKGIYAASFFLDWHTPKMLSGEGALNKIPQVLRENSVRHPLLVSDGGIVKVGLFALLTDALDKRQIDYSVFTDVVPNPTIENVESAVKAYKDGGCDSIIALGGGSAMDCAKAAGARISNPDKKVEQMRGLLKISKKLPLLIAIPTTAGTGSETTLAAVISNGETHDKYPLEDPKLIPSHAVLDPSLTENLPKHITSTTGMDALTHAIEAYIGKANTKETEKNALKAIKLIHENLLEAYTNGHNLEARTNMQNAAFYAGIAFTRAYVGCVHSIAHTLGAHYGTPHGLAVAVVLPHVLRYYGESAHKRLAEIALHIGLGAEGDTIEKLANTLIDYISELNAKMEIPDKFTDTIKAEDVEAMVDAAYHEAVPLYPTPKTLYKNDYRKLFKIISE